EARVRAAEALVELVRLEAALRETHRLLRPRADPVLVPGDVPDEGDHDLPVRPLERHQADARLTEAPRDALDGAEVVAGVEERCGVGDRLLVLGQAPRRQVAGDGL